MGKSSHTAGGLVVAAHLFEQYNCVITLVLPVGAGG
jgi:hypothetical protein